MKPHLFLLMMTASLVATVSSRGQDAGSFARMGFGARGIALSNALVADAPGGGSPYYNPALAPYLERQHLSASASLLSFDRELQFLQFASPLKPRAGVAAGLIHGGVSNIDGRDGSGYHTQEYRTDEYAFFLNFGARVGSRFTVGVGLQLFQADYLASMQPVRSLGIDLGLTARAAEGLYLGFAVEDLLARYTWAGGGTSATDRFPTRFRLGGAWTLTPRLRTMAEYEWRLRHGYAPTGTPLQPRGMEMEHRRIDEHQLRLGLEMQLAAPFAVRAGLDRLTSRSPQGVTPSAGFKIDQGIGQLDVRLEYAFMLEPQAVGTMHVLTLHLFL